MCHHGTLSLIGPPCLLSPYRYCVSTARAFSVPERRGGTKGWTEEGGRERRGEGGKESKCCSCAVPALFGHWQKCLCLIISVFSVSPEKRVLAQARVCLPVCNSQLSMCDARPVHGNPAEHKQAVQPVNMSFHPLVPRSMTTEMSSRLTEQLILIKIICIFWKIIMIYCRSKTLLVLASQDLHLFGTI